ncbi:hypothetical protein [Mycobacterium sp. E2497]|uniref:PPE domain-containing protein n=1 Tax=Mycobacterium sp. E2497 TaxID=1834135 RepID=UPI0007FE0335|nr:hypothetical protein [Mycobacterium sp. E2497]OBI18140.1 hypothetical protein A5713_18115 [Mycobacterium sp. E2497]
MTQTLNVEYQELIARADELEQPLPTVPSTNPSGPCNLSFIHDTAARLALTADTFRTYLKGCEREWKALAKSLRNAAKAYEEVDTGAAEDINKILTDGAPAAGIAPAKLAAEEEPWTPPGPAAAAAPFEYPYYEVRQAAADIEAGDQGTSFRAFAQEWETFQRAFREETNRFRLFNTWEGEATAQVEQNFQRQKEWIYSMAKLCGDLAQQANRVVDVHKKATATTGYNKRAVDGAHPSSYEVSQCDYWYRRYVESNNQYYVSVAIQWYERLQAQSESALKYYVQYANLPLKVLTPDAPPKAMVIKPPDTTPKPNPDDPNAGTPNPDGPDASPKPEPTPTPGGTTPAPIPTPAQIGQLAGNLSDGVQGLSQGMQGVQGMMQGVQGFAQGGGSMPASLASDTTAIDPQVDEEKKDDDKKDDEETQDPATLVDGAAAGDQASGSAPTGPPAAGGQAGAAPSEVVL